MLQALQRSFGRLSFAGMIFLLLTSGTPCSFSEEKAAPPSKPSPESEYFDVRGPCRLEFPRDYGAHPGFRVEWWYYTGNLRSENGDRYGFQLTFFRTQISPPGSETLWPETPSHWRTQQMFLAHAAVSSIGEQAFRFDEKMARGAVGLAGVEREASNIRIFLGAWSTRMEPEMHRLHASSEDFAFDLLCRPVKPPVSHGDQGYSRKGSSPQDASCYSSFTRLETSGKLVLQGSTFSVRGTAWMDHEYSSEPLDETVAGWDWFGLQLTNRTELMIYLLRREKGGIHPASSGTFVTRSGEPLHLSLEDIRVQVLDTWRSRKSGAVYPSRWHIRIAPLDLDLRITSNVPDQELHTQTPRLIYWEGSVSISGNAEGKAVDGAGYVEMTGYARPFGLLQ